MARVHLPIGSRQDAILVPKDSLVLGGQQPIVYAVIPGEGEKPASVRPVSVLIGTAIGEWIEVKALLQPGEQVVTRGNERLRPGQAVAVVGTSPEPPPEDGADSSTELEKPAADKPEAAHDSTTN